MDVELEVLIGEAAGSSWAEGPSRRLAEGIEERIVAPLSSRLRVALGHDEAAQLARVIAWERCLELAENPPPGGVSWGYLATHVRWRLKDTLRAETLRQRKHPVTPHLPEPEPGERPWLGRHLEAIAVELEREGLPARTARKLIRVAADGPPFNRASVTQRLRRVGATGEQAEAMAWLLRGGAGRPSALARLALGQPVDKVFSDRVVRDWLRVAAGRDLRFFGRSAVLARRRSPRLGLLNAA